MSLTDDILMHYGMPRRSGRYPWGSGDNPYQHSGDFLSRVEELKMLSYLGWIDCTDTYLMYRKWIKPCINFQQLKRKVSRYDKYDEKRVYQKLVSLYTAKGGKSHGVKLQVCREHSPTDCT